MEPTAPETTPTAPPVNPLAAMTPDQRQAWKADDSSFDYGELKPAPVEPPTETPEAESSPAQPAEQPEQAASTDATPVVASEPAKPKQNAETRVKELLAERKQLEDRLKALETRPAPPIDPPKTSPAADFPAFETWTVEHPTESYEHYLDARADFRAERRQAIQQVEQARTSRISTYLERLNEAKQDPTFIPKLSPDVANLVPVDLLEPGTPITPDNLIAQEVVHLRNPQLMVYLSEHPDEFRRLRSLPTPADIIRDMGRLDERVTTGVKVPTPPKLISNLSPPPKTVNQRPAEAADPVLTAVNSGDFRAFKAAEDAADRARQR